MIAGAGAHRQALPAAARDLLLFRLGVVTPAPLGQNPRAVLG